MSANASYRSHFTQLALDKTTPIYSHEASGAVCCFLSKPRIRGGVHAEEHKAATAAQAIVNNFPLPEKLYIPLQQHVGKPAEPLIRVGDKVLKGQLLAYSQGMISAPVHAPSSGIILDVNDYPAPHPSALPIRMIVLETDGKDEWLATKSLATRSS